MSFRKTAGILFFMCFCFSLKLEAQLDEFLTFSSPRARVDGYAIEYDNDGNLIFIIEVQKTEGTIAENNISFGPYTISSTDIVYPNNRDYRKVIIGSMAPDLSLNWIRYSQTTRTQRMRIFDMETSPSGDLYFLGTGQLEDRFLFDENGDFDRSADVLSSYFIMKMSAEGIFQWVNRLPASLINNSEGFNAIGQDVFELDVDELGTAYAFVRTHSKGNNKERPDLEVDRRTTHLWSVDCEGNTAFLNPIPQLFETIFDDGEPFQIQLNSHVMDAQLYKNAFYVTVKDQPNSLGGGTNHRLMKFGLKGDLIWEKRFPRNANMYGMSLRIRNDVMVVSGGYRHPTLSYGETELISGVTFTSACCRIENFHPFILSTDLDGNLQNYWVDDEYNGIVDVTITDCNQVLAFGNPVRIFDMSLSLIETFEYTADLGWLSEVHSRGDVILGQNKYSILDPVILQFTSLQDCFIPENSAEVPISVQSCAGSSRTIGSGLGDNFTYEWFYESDLLADIADTLIVTQSGNYVQRVYGPCLNLQKSITYDFNQLPTPDAPELSHQDTTYVCEASLVLSSISGEASWSTGEMGQSINITENGQYWANVLNEQGCMSVNSDTVTVVFVTLPGIPEITTMGPIEFCEGDSIQLVSNITEDLLWSTGETTESIYIKASGQYFVRQVSEHCDASANSNVIEVNVNPIPVQPTITVSGSLELCEGESVTLTSSSTIGNVWSNGGTGQSIQVSQSGSYSVLVSQNGCESDVSEIITVNVSPAFSATMQDRERICEGNTSVVLRPAVTDSAVEYLWSDGSTEARLEVFEEGSYWVEVYNAACMQRLSVEVTDGCYPSLLIPDAFSPNGDGMNDTFEVIGINLTSFEIYIYNSWGTIVFHSTDLANQWDGTFNQKLLPMGSYPYQVIYAGDVDGEIVSFSEAGAAKLLR